MRRLFTPPHTHTRCPSSSLSRTRTFSSPGGHHRACSASALKSVLRVRRHRVRRRRHLCRLRLRVRGHGGGRDSGRGLLHGRPDGLGVGRHEGGPAGRIARRGYRCRRHDRAVVVGGAVTRYLLVARSRILLRGAKRPQESREHTKEKKSQPRGVTGVSGIPKDRKKLEKRQTTKQTPSAPSGFTTQTETHKHTRAHTAVALEPPRRCA